MKHHYQKISVHPKTGRPQVETINHEKSMTQQQFKDECDINFIMDKYQKTGEFNSATLKKGVYGDFSNITDYHDMVQTVKYANEAFMLLPANVRTRFRNDPGQLLEFLQDDSNYDEAKKLGLLNLTPPPPEAHNPNATKSKQRDQQPPSSTNPPEPAKAKKTEE